MARQGAGAGVDTSLLFLLVARRRMDGGNGYVLRNRALAGRMLLSNVPYITVIESDPHTHSVP
jgi:hypothetical protein